MKMGQDFGTGLAMPVRQEKVRAGRRQALRSISEVVVLTMDDGQSPCELVLDARMTLGEICARLGPQTIVTALRTERRTRTAASRPKMLHRA